jgi:hypothetical protein
VVRVELSGGDLWHLMLDEAGAPERLEARLSRGGRTLDVTCTCFEDEVLVWRRGGEPASEALAIPPGYRLLWPPIAGRDLALAGAARADGGPAAVMCLWLKATGPEQGGLRARPVKFTLRPESDGFHLDTPGLDPMQAVLAPDGSLAAWRQGEAEWVVEDET